MAPNTLDGSAFSFTSLKGHTTHISILWVFVLFTFFAVAVVSLGGQQKGLVERQFPDTKVNGDLDVTGKIQRDVGLIAPTNIDTTPKTAAFTAEYERFYLIGVATGNTVTLPAPREGSAIRFLFTGNTGVGTVTFGTAANPRWATGSTLIRTGIASSSVTATQSTGTQNLLNITGAAAGGGGAGTTVDLVGVKENGVDRWLVNAFSKLQGTSGAADTSAFA